MSISEDNRQFIENQLMDRMFRTRQGSGRGNLAPGRSYRVAVSEISFAARFNFGHTIPKYTRLDGDSSAVPSEASGQTTWKGENSDDDIAEQEADAIFKWIGPELSRQHRGSNESESEELCLLLSDTNDDEDEEDFWAEMQARELFRWIGPNPFIQDTNPVVEIPPLLSPSSELLEPLLNENETERCVASNESSESVKDHSGPIQASSPHQSQPENLYNDSVQTSDAIPNLILWWRLNDSVPTQASCLNPMHPRSHKESVPASPSTTISESFDDPSPTRAASPNPNFSINLNDPVPTQAASASHTILESFDDPDSAQAASSNLPRSLGSAVEEKVTTGPSQHEERVPIKSPSSIGVLCMMYGSVDDLVSDEDCSRHNTRTRTTSSGPHTLSGVWSVHRSSSAPSFSCLDRDPPDRKAFAYEHRGMTQSLSSVTMRSRYLQPCLWRGSVSDDYEEMVENLWAYDNLVFSG